MADLTQDIDDTVEVTDDAAWRYGWPGPARITVDVVDRHLDVDLPDEAES